MQRRHCLTICYLAVVLLGILYLYNRRQEGSCRSSATSEEGSGVVHRTVHNVPVLSKGHVLDYSASMKWMHAAMQESIYRFDRGLSLPLLKLTPQEQNRDFRISEARRWLKSQNLAVGATVRNAMRGLVPSVAILRRLSDVFHSVTAVFVENDSTDRTRSYLYELTQQSTDKFRVILLGCGTVNSAMACHINISYGSSGQRHRVGHMDEARRNLAEESMDRGMVMGALRNIYLQFIYDNIDADLLLVLESDLNWEPWDMDSVLQGLHHFKTKPQLDSLCSRTMQNGRNLIQDPCTSILFHSNYFYIDSAENQMPFTDRNGLQWTKLFQTALGTSEGRNGTQAFPVKMASCFQGAAFYRMSSLRAASAFYRYSEGEWHCEHTTLSKQLRENYLDTEMRLLSNN